MEEAEQAGLGGWVGGKEGHGRLERSFRSLELRREALARDMHLLGAIRVEVVTETSD